MVQFVSYNIHMYFLRKSQNCFKGTVSRECRFLHPLYSLCIYLLLLSSLLLQESLLVRAFLSNLSYHSAGGSWGEDQEGAGRLLGEEGLQRGHRRSTCKYRYFLNSRSSCVHLFIEGCRNLGCGSGSALICNSGVLLAVLRICIIFFVSGWAFHFDLDTDSSFNFDADLTRMTFPFDLDLDFNLWIRIYCTDLPGLQDEPSESEPYWLLCPWKLLDG
jgi:hypothetical protein